MNKEQEKQVINKYLQWKVKLENQTGFLGEVSGVIRRYENRTHKFIMNFLKQS